MAHNRIHGIDSPDGADIWFSASVINSGTPEDNLPELVISVKDKGIGIPAEHQSRLFERFYKHAKRMNENSCAFFLQTLATAI